MLFREIQYTQLRSRTHTSALLHSRRRRRRRRRHRRYIIRYLKNIKFVYELGEAHDKYIITPMTHRYIITNILNTELILTSKSDVKNCYNLQRVA